MAKLNDMRIMKQFSVGEAVSIDNKEYVVGSINRDARGDIQITFQQKKFITKRPEDER